MPSLALFFFLPKEGMCSDGIPVSSRNSNSDLIPPYNLLMYFFCV